MSVTIREYYSKRLKKKTFAYELDLTLQQHRIREKKRGFFTKTEAKEEGERRELEIKKKAKLGYDIKDVITKDKNKITVKELLDLWSLSKKASISPKTYSFYQFMTGMINSDLGKLKAVKLKTEQIELFINKRLSNGLSSTTAGHYYTVLNIAYNWAIQRGYVLRNPCRLMKKPKSERKEMHVYDETQLDKLFKSIKNYTIYYPTLLAATTGLRLGEICGLTWENVDLKNGIIQVKQQLQEVDKELITVPLKTKRSQRKIVLLDITIEALKELKIKQDFNKKYLEGIYNDSGFVICQSNGNPYNPQYMTRNFRRVLSEQKHKINIDGKQKELSLCQILNIPLIRFHDLRHSHATILLKANTNPKIVSERLGHADVGTTLNIYSHILPDMQRNAIDKLNRIMNPKIDT